MIKPKLHEKFQQKAVTAPDSEIVYFYDVYTHTVKITNFTVTVLLQCHYFCPIQWAQVTDS